VTADEKKIERTAQRLIVEARRGYGSPPQFGNWKALWDAKVDRIEINGGSRPSVATIWFPSARWNENLGILWGDNIRILTEKDVVVFAGFVTSYLSDFSGGTERSPAYERNAIVCQSYRWLLAATSPIYGQSIRGPDDYKSYGTDEQQPIANSCIFASGRRAIFNADGRPNRDPTLLKLETCEIPIFADPDIAEFWTARDMLRYVMSPPLNKAYDYLPISDPNQLPGIDHNDWEKVLNHIIVDGLSVIEAVELICKHIGWSFREDYEEDGNVLFNFYKVGIADKHTLHAPAVGENIESAVARGKKLLWSMSLAQDIAAVVNKPWGLGAPHRFEFTAELVPAWKDDDLEPDESEEYANLFFTEADLQAMTDPNSKSYYKYYHPRGSSFRRNVGRKWALNESGRYSKSSNYDRGMPFEFKDIIPAKYILDKTGKRLYAPVNRQLLPALTVDKDTLSSVGIKVEFSFDGGSTWQIIPAAISSSKDECAIYIDEANLAELVDEAEGTISGGDLDGIQLNYWTSLCDDILNERPFKDGEWKTRIRITASIQLDQRLRKFPEPSPASGSPFLHRQIYDFSEKYGLIKRTESSIYAPSSPPADSDLPAWEIDSGDWFDKHLQAVRDANEDMSVSGQFTLERMWFDVFAIGDCITKITGRNYNLWAGYVYQSGKKAEKVTYPEIIQIIYLPDAQKMKLITRDLRFAEVVL